MFVSSVNPQITTNFKINQPVKKNVVKSNDNYKNSSRALPLGFNTSYKVSFKAWTNPNRLVGDVDLESYYMMSEPAKERYRKLCEEFATSKEIDTNKLFDKEANILPLMEDNVMEKFIETSKIYLQYKDQPIVCLGRSPKWFLNTAFWMNDGIPEYKFAAFSKHWYRNDPVDGVRKIKHMAPTEEEETAYRKYLDRIGVNPQTMVNTMRETGKKTIITDYICSGKGACSFLDILSRYADDLGILEEFSKSFDFVGIGSIDYMEELDMFSDLISRPRVLMPPLLQPYEKNIKQTFYNMDYTVFNQMLLNQNTNECRSSYYPHQAWTVYSPDTFKVGLIKDMSVVERVKDHFKDEKYITLFTAPMQDFRNLLNFRILDYLNSKDMLRKVALPTFQKLH